VAADDRPRRPSLGLLLLEGRAVLEFGALLPAYPLLRAAPRGDGHPVLVLPGFMASDLATRPLRRVLRDRGWAVHGWKLGRNEGPDPVKVAALVERLGELRRRYGRRVSLVGWSLGGIYARELARAHPSDVRQVITLAAPFRDVDATNVPALLRAGRGRHPREAELRARLTQPLPVPLTAIYSRSDGIVDWRSCVADAGPLSESIEVESSHLGIAYHPVVLRTVADRLREPEGAWRPFRPSARWRWPLAARVSGAPGGDQPPPGGARATSS
jgi:pimeloyl-ACP methyl ester carboxylesterase